MRNLDPVAADNRAFVVPELPIQASDAAAEPDGKEDAVAPLIFGAWYAIAPSKDVGRTLGRIKVLGEPLVYYRTGDGRPVVLDDRCAHRRFPLSKGQLVGDTIQCGYHGFTYAATGQCIWAPGVPLPEGQEAKLPFGIRAYPCAERGPWLWAWMGKPEQADPANIPLPELDLEGHSQVCGYKLNPANYMLVIENLLDLSHLHFLHGATSVDHAAVAPGEAPAPPGGVAWRKVVESTETGLIGAICGDDPKRLVRLEDGVTQVGPSLNYGFQRRQALPEDCLQPVKPAVLTVMHALTPVDSRNTHQFFMVHFSAPFVTDASEVLRTIEDVVFEQDAQAVLDMQAYIDEDVRRGRVEFSMACDRFGIRMRRILRDMKKHELGGD